MPPVRVCGQGTLPGFFRRHLPDLARPARIRTSADEDCISARSQRSEGLHRRLILFLRAQRCPFRHREKTQIGLVYTSLRPFIQLPYDVLSHVAVLGYGVDDLLAIQMPAQPDGQLPRDFTAETSGTPGRGQKAVGGSPGMLQGIELKSAPGVRSTTAFIAPKCGQSYPVASGSIHPPLVATAPISKMSAARGFGRRGDSGLQVSGSTWACPLSAFDDKR